MLQSEPRVRKRLALIWAGISEFAASREEQGDV